MIAPSPESVERIWQVAPRDRGAEDRLIDQLKISRILALFLVSRGLTDLEEAKKFLNPSLDQLHDPSLLPDMDRAVELLLKARKEKKLIYIHGDYDVDGVTSTALLHRFLTKIGCEVVSHVPHRVEEGYGIHAKAVAWAVGKGAEVFLTCDCGSNAFDQIAEANAAGMQVVITDHHLLRGQAPAAAAHINAHRPGSTYPFPEICGVVVAFKLCIALATQLEKEEPDLKVKAENVRAAYLDLAAIGTIADIMPLEDENRAIAKFGLDRLKETKKKGLQSLIAVASLQNKPVTVYHVGFQLGPRLNAVGRIDDASHALQLLITEQESEANELAQMLDRINLERRQQQEVAIDHATQLILEQGLHKRNAIVVAHEAWHTGIVGIVAGKLVEIFNRPVFCLSILEDGIAKGSARTIRGFHLGNALERVRPLLKSGGGHEMAAGLSLRRELLPEFDEAMNAYGGEVLRPEDFERKLYLTGELTAEDLTQANLAGIELAAPFGMGNPTPHFMIRKAKIAGIKPLGGEDNCRLVFDVSGTKHEAVAFRKCAALTELGIGAEIDLSVKVELNEWNGRSSYQLKLEDYRLPAGT